ncbi:hypothetical protein ZYGR_0N05550 [Zygosaccharomyces rouxii]|uniref:Serine/threonine-protein phosphatase n=1 Tax=Zygosaccharomyces rouxii TaxID=4956 RepID=A0A1Q3A0D1_ZYGRO|nr:hypothetical protein ZYGR_0N05550 [Zygosaccharomyces rouxii]
MGNSGSKTAKGTRAPVKGSNGDGSSLTPPFTRTDTSQSAKSTRSLRSLRSRRSESGSTSAQGTPQMLPVNDSESPLPSNIGVSTPTGKDFSSSSGSGGGGSHRNHRRHSNSELPPSSSNKEQEDQHFQTPQGSSTDGNHLNPNMSAQPPTPMTSSRRRSSSKRPSISNADLPPSMIQMEPKSPILKNSNYTIGNVLNYNENALTDEDEDDAANDGFSKGGKSQLDSVRHSHSSRPSSVRSSSSSRVRRRSDNYGNNGGGIADSDLLGSQLQAQQHGISRSNSHASSHSRKSSASAGNTAYSTPLNSPGIFANSHGNGNNGPGQDDYFGSAAMASLHGSNNHHYDPNHSSDSVNRSLNNSLEESGGNDNNSSSHHLTMDATAAEADPSLINHHQHHDSKSRSNSFEGYPTALPTDPELAEGAIDGGSESQQHGKKKKVHKPINIDETIQKLLDAGYAGKRTKNVCLKNSEIAQICHLAREIFLSQPSLLELSPPVKIVGDVHGQYADLLRLFTKCGFPPAANYLFLGDYVDRGKQSLETILLLLCYKIKYPENFFLLRGNHECANVTRVYGFYDECKRRCNIKTWKIFIDTFNTLPLAAIIAGKIFCVHGGLSPVLNSMDEIRHFSRPTDVPDFGLINDLLWSDPTDSPNEWEDNERGVSYCYNKVAINKFLNKFGFDLVCRAHMVVEDGYEFFNDRSLVTVFSAPNYCGEFDNWGAVMSVSEGLLCSFELLDPLDSAALKQVMKKGRQERKLANQQQFQGY